MSTRNVPDSAFIEAGLTWDRSKAFVYDSNIPEHVANVTSDVAFPDKVVLEVLPNES